MLGFAGAPGSFCKNLFSSFMAFSYWCPSLFPSPALVISAPQRWQNLDMFKTFCSCEVWQMVSTWGPIQVIDIRPALIRATLPQPSSSSEALPWCLPWAGETHGPGESLGQRGAAACGLMVPHHAACLLDGKSNILGQRHGFTAAAVKLLSFLTSPSRKISQI